MPGIKPGEEFQIRFKDNHGKVLLFHNIKGRKLLNFDLTEVSEVNMQEGLFPDQVLYIGLLMWPNTSMKIDKFELEFDEYRQDESFYFMLGC